MKENNLLKFLYKTSIGRVLLRIITSPCISKLIGKFLDTKSSKIFIKKAIKNNNIDMSLYENINYKSFNDFFTRRKKEITIDKDENNLISPCDGNLIVYKIEDNNTFKIKNSIYTVSSLIEDNNISNEFKEGYCLVFRLAPNNYHRYCFIDNGKKSKNVFIKGVLHTVRPIAFENNKVFQTNSREWTILETENFDKIIQIEIGALLVGKIVNYHQEYQFRKGEEKGKFEYGGSTIVLLIKKDKVLIDKKIIENSKNNIETPVIIGKKIGISK